MKIYLSGPTKFYADESIRWRLDAREKLFEAGNYYAFIPDEHFNYQVLKPPTEKACKSLFIKELKKSDLVLVNLKNSADSCGTCWELAIAEEYGLPIIGFGYENAYTWAIESCDVVLDDLDEAIDYITLHY